MKKVVIFVGVLAVAIASQAGFLNWQVESGMSFNGQEIGGGNLYAVGGEALAANMVGSGVALSDIGNNTSFYVEFVNYNNEVIARSDSASYESLATSIGTDEIGAAKMATWHPQASQVPEPTSALLMMMGVAFLGLKRRKV